MTELTAEIVRELLDYDPETGILTWRIRKREWFKTDASWKRWNSRFMGEGAFTADSHGYRQGHILGKRCDAHRIIWLHYYGEWPDQIDHINGKKDDNRIENLRSVTHQENCKNQPHRETNTSGYIGVYWHKQRQKWAAQIQVDSRVYYLGLFTDISGAIAARKAAEVEHDFHPNHGRA